MKPSSPPVAGVSLLWIAPAGVLRGYDGSFRKALLPASLTATLIIELPHACQTPIKSIVCCSGAPGSFSLTTVAVVGWRVVRFTAWQPVCFGSCRCSAETLLGCSLRFRLRIEPAEAAAEGSISGFEPISFRFGASMVCWRLGALKIS